MKGLYLGIGDKCIEKATQNSTELQLLAKGDGVEVLLQKVSAGKVFSVDSGEPNDIMEYFHIIEGSLNYDPDKENVILNKGDYFYVHHLQEAIKFKTITDVTLLYVTSQPLFQFLSSTINELSGIMKKVQIKDMYTHNHCKRVKDYAVKIALKLHISKEGQEKVAYAALFHDIGKINVPSEILNKPGHLTDEEMNCIKKHPSDGEIMVNGTLYKDINKIIEQHHEWLDGSGYPKGLKDEDILLEARIIAIADTYDAMTSDRPYRNGLKPIVALQELKRFSGVHYDSRIVNTFESILIDEGIIDCNEYGNLNK